MGYRLCFGLLGRFRRAIGRDTCLRLMAENLSFSRFKAVFMGYSLCFGLLGQFQRAIGPDAGLRVMAENLPFS